ncbi:MAG: GNAT family N-acetyltransferase [Gemmatimonadetes bacterium]|nr:GNAT family N-acetyltransferase [Gemmatimonadota bacterium]
MSNESETGQIEYAIESDLTVDEFIGVLKASTLSERRPVDDHACVAGMIERADLIVTARAGGSLVGVARSVTDFHYCCYLSDLAVDERYQKRGIGKRLVDETRARLGPRCTLILLSAPAAIEYYPRLGFERHPQAWILEPGKHTR